jgi:Holliday junction resolvase-like predicted endonuclease
VNKTGYLKVEVKSDKDGRCIAKQIDRDHEFYVDPANLTLTKDIVDLLDKEMSEDKAVAYLKQSGWLAKHEREIHDAANKDLIDENERLKRRVGDYTLQIEQLLAEIKAYRKTIMDNQEMNEKRAADYLVNHGWKVVANNYFAEAPERKEKRDVTKNNEIVIDVKTRGMEEAHEQIEALADAYDGFPAQVNIKGARDCVFNIYPSQTKIIGMDSDPEGGDGE